MINQQQSMNSNLNPVATTESIKRAVNALKKSGINFLAIDFDYTLVETKTEKDHLVEQIRVRHLFKEFVPIAMDEGFYVAIVTFAEHLDLIQRVLGSNFPTHANNITVRSNQHDHHRKWGGSGFLSNKQNHIASAACEYNGAGPMKISRKSTLLIDDEHENIKAALLDSTHALLFNPQQPYLLIHDILEVYDS